MGRGIWRALAVLGALSASPAAQGAVASEPVEAPPAPSPNYAAPTAWGCRPGTQGACGGNLDVERIWPDGRHQTIAFHPAASPPVDCFYVYPTVSQQDTDYAQPVREPSVDKVLQGQAARLASVCRVFAPLYRQLTSAHLRRRLAGGTLPHGHAFDVPEADISAAWHYYLNHDNHGRGVVLIGHSQGSILLTRLLADEIENTPADSLLVSAILPGNRLFRVPLGQLNGGTLRRTPLCSRAGEFACLTIWSSYPAGMADPDDRRAFGRAAHGAACVNPASPSGEGAVILHPVMQRRDRDGPEDGPAFIAPEGVETGGCAPDGDGTVMQLSFASPAAETEILGPVAGRKLSGWGYHGFDFNLVEDDILALIKTQAHGWLAMHRQTARRLH